MAGISAGAVIGRSGNAAAIALPAGGVAVVSRPAVDGGLYLPAIDIDLSWAF